MSDLCSKLNISIHAPLTGSDDQVTFDDLMQQISIHAPLTGSDKGKVPRNREVRYFNPRSPYGERPVTIGKLVPPGKFQSTLPLRGATCCGRYELCSDAISIHAPLTGSDKPAPNLRPLFWHFNPRSPYGERRRVVPNFGT